MKIDNASKKPLNNQQGAVIVLMAFLLFVLLGVTAFAIDFGYRHVVRNELQNAADAAALAAARDLGRIYESMDPDAQLIYVCGSTDQARIKEVAIKTGEENYAGDVKELKIYGNDIQIGLWDPLSRSFSESSAQPDAVKVIARRQSIDGNENGPISTFFAPIFGIRTMEVNALATATLTPIASIGEGGLPIPVGISQQWFDKSNWDDEEKGFCDQNIKFHPTGDLAGCAGWHIYQQKEQGAAPASLLKRTISKMNPWCAKNNDNYDKDYCFEEYDPDFKSPAIDGNGNDSFTFTGGNDATAFPYMEALYNANKDSEGNWEVTVPVYENNDCGKQPSGSTPIVGFASAVITGVDTAPNLEIRAKVICKLIEPGRGGGADFGTNGSVPNLVE
jgi:hypothetical protein